MHYDEGFTRAVWHSDVPQAAKHGNDPPAPLYYYHYHYIILQYNAMTSLLLSTITITLPLQLYYIAIISQFYHHYNAMQSAPLYITIVFLCTITIGIAIPFHSLPLYITHGIQCNHKQFNQKQSSPNASDELAMPLQNLTLTPLCCFLKPPHRIALHCIEQNPMQGKEKAKHCNEHHCTVAMSLLAEIHPQNI